MRLQITGTCTVAGGYRPTTQLEIYDNIAMSLQIHDIVVSCHSGAITQCNMYSSIQYCARIIYFLHITCTEFIQCCIIFIIVDVTV